MRNNLIALFAGTIFGLGLGISQMTDRARVPGFLDITGLWDPTLLFVLAGAVAVTMITFRFVLRRPHPLWESQFYLPTRKDIDVPLLVGSGIFGIGWAMAGWCPAPGITALTLGSVDAVLFVVALATGMLIHRWWSRSDPTESKPVQPSASA